MEKTKMDNFRLIGLKLEHKTTNENGQAAIDCGNMWQRFEKEMIFHLIPDKLDYAIHAVYYDYDKDETAPYAYFIGCKVTESAEIPPNLSELRIPSQTYLTRNARGVMPACIAEEWQKIWASKMDRKFGFDFEIYDERSMDWSSAEVDIFLSVNE